MSMTKSGRTRGTLRIAKSVVDPEARAIMENAQQEEFKHFAMDLEFLSRRTPKWRAALQAILFQNGDIGGHGEGGEKAEEKA